MASSPQSAEQRPMASKFPVAWHKAAESQLQPVKRRGHSVCAVGKQAIVFGGWYAGQTVKDMWLLNTESFKWQRFEPQTAGAVPIGRMGHTAISHGDNMVLFGGEAGTHCVNDVWKFDVVNQEWSRVKFDPDAYLPHPRYGHAACVYGNHMLVMGGADRFPKATDDPSFLSDLWVYDLEKEEWFEAVPEGKIPAKRYGHTLSVVNGRVFMFGGFGSGGRMNDLWELDPTTYRWTCIQSPGAWPYRRANHTAVGVGSKLMVFGGLGSQALSDLWEFDTTDMKWMRWEMKRYPRTLDDMQRKNIFHPGGRYDAAACLFDTNKMLLFGGVGDGNFLFQDLWYLTTVEGSDPKSQRETKQIAHDLTGLGTDAFVAEVASLIQRQSNEFLHAVDSRVDQHFDARAKEDATLRDDVEMLKSRFAVEKGKRADLLEELRERMEPTEALERRLAQVEGKLGIEPVNVNAASRGGSKVSDDRMDDLEEAQKNTIDRLEALEKQRLSTNQMMLRLKAEVQNSNQKLDEAADSSKMRELQNNVEELKLALNQLEEKTKKTVQKFGQELHNRTSKQAEEDHASLEEIRAVLEQRKAEDHTYKKTQFENLKKLHENQKKQIQALEGRIVKKIQLATSANQANEELEKRVGELEEKLEKLQVNTQRVTLHLQNELRKYCGQKDEEFLEYKQYVETQFQQLRENNDRQFQKIREFMRAVEGNELALAHDRADQRAKYAMVGQKIKETIETADTLQHTITEFQSTSSPNRSVASD